MTSAVVSRLSTGQVTAREWLADDASADAPRHAPDGGKGDSSKGSVTRKVRRRKVAAATEAAAGEVAAVEAAAVVQPTALAEATPLVGR